MYPDDITVLIVEDEPDGRETLTLLFEMHGYAVLAAKNGREALVLLEEEPLPSVILLDLNMPVMNGWKFREAQLKVPEWANIPTFIISAVADRNEISKSLYISGFYTKPIDFNSLHRDIADCLNA